MRFPFLRVVHPDVGTVHAEIGERELVPVEGVAHLPEKILFDGRQEAGPDIRRADVIPEAKQIQIAENVTLSLALHAVEGIGRDAGFQTFHDHLLL